MSIYYECMKADCRWMGEFPDKAALFLSSSDTCPACGGKIHKTSDHDDLKREYEEGEDE